MSEIVRYEQADGVAVITLNRPDAMNSFTSQLSIDLLDALETAQHDDLVRAVVLTGEGRCFSGVRISRAVSRGARCTASSSTSIVP